MRNLDRYGRRLMGSAVYQGYPIARYFNRIADLEKLMASLRVKNPELQFEINPGGESFKIVNADAIGQ